MDLDDDVANMTSNTTETIYKHDVTFEERLFLELFTVVGLASVAANFLQIFLVVKFKKMRRQVTNVLLAHLAFLEAIFLFTCPLITRIVSLFEEVTEVHVTVFCVLYQLEYIVLLAICPLLCLLVCDWYIKVYRELLYVKFCNVYKFFVAFIYICVLFLGAVSTQFCLKRISVVYVEFLFFAYVLFFASLVVMNVVHCFKRKTLREDKNNVGLCVPNIFSICWCPALVKLLFLIFGDGIHSYLVTILLFCLGFSSPVFVVLYLFYKVDDYNIFLRKVFKCQCNDYSNELLEDQSVSYVEDKGVNISRNNTFVISDSDASQ